MKNLVNVSCTLLVIMLVTNAYAAKSGDGEKIDLTDIEARLTALEGGVTVLEGDVTALEGGVTALEGGVTALEGDVTALEGGVTALEGDVTALEGGVTALEDGVKTRADGGLYMVTQTEVGLNGSCVAGNPSIIHQAVRGWAFMVPNEDSNRMDLLVNFDNAGPTNPGMGSLSSFRSDFDISLGEITEEGVRQANEGIAFATVFIDSGEITLDPDASPWEPAPIIRPPHYNNQSIWGGMSDDGSMFTIVAHLITEVAGEDDSDCTRASLITLVGARSKAE